MTMMKYMSLFSGIEAATVAWQPLGWEPVAFAEIEEFPCSVLAHHYPSVPNLGSVTDITDDQIKALGHIDIVVGGSPCQDLSVAGKRGGLAGERSGLFHEQLRIFNAARKFCGARWLVWENVTGAFSSNRGRDFAVVVGAMAGCTLDVPENGWGTEGVAMGNNGLVEWCVLDAQWFGVAQRRRRVFAVLDTCDWQRRPPVLFEPERLHSATPSRRSEGQESASCIQRGTGQRLDAVVSSYGIPGNWIGRAAKNGGNATQPPFEVSPCLTATDRHGVATSVHSDGMQVVRRLTPVECERLQGFPDNYTAIPYRKNPASECPDSPRYKAIGNSMAVPVMRWIGKQIAAAALFHNNNKNNDDDD